jgi:lipopolysaccharide/colanic/teichoic acid biosynthesis glycosyltransferase
VPKAVKLMMRSSRLSELRDLLAEPQFLRALCLERKRTERSRNPFVLMLLGLTTAVTKSVGDDGLFDRIVPIILRSVRETDIVGWHKDRSTLGVIFAELGVADKDSVLAALRERVTHGLRTVLRVDELKRINITFYCFPEDWKADDSGQNGGSHAMGRRGTIAPLYPDLAQRDDSKTLSRLVKRAIDVIGSCLALIVLLPVFLAVAAAVKLTSPGPILFRQKRIGQYGTPFTFLKFRTMYTANDPRIHQEYVKRFIAGDIKAAASETNGKAVYKITKDPRLTRVGGLLRRTSLDELPQFLNVLRGEMSLVGPRPPVLYEVDAYDVWHRRRVLEVKPGITGLWQVSGRSRLRFDDMVRLDLRYAQAWSLWLDLKILVQTPRAVLSGEGAY